MAKPVKPRKVTDDVVGTQPPKGYIEWHLWAEAQQKAGLRQRQCPTCKLYRFPQEKCCEGSLPEKPRSGRKR